MKEPTVAEIVAELLIQRGRTLSTVECGTRGIVSRRVFETDDGPAVIGDSLIVDRVEEAIELLDLPRPQFKNKGDFSAKAARAAAREGRRFFQVDLCLAVWGPEAACAAEAKHVHLALDLGSEVVDETLPYGGTDEEEMGKLADQALDLVRKALS